jgi:hypothetical protein
MANAKSIHHSALLEEPLRRHLVGILAMLLLLGGIAFWIWPPSEQYEQFYAMCWRLGGILAVLWLAYPDLCRLPGWLLLALPVLAIVLVRWPRLFLWLIPLLIALAILNWFLSALLRPRR